MHVVLMLNHIVTNAFVAQVALHLPSEKGMHSKGSKSVVGFSLLLLLLLLQGPQPIPPTSVELLCSYPLGVLVRAQGLNNFQCKNYHTLIP